eukprot:g64983.t1
MEVEELCDSFLKASHDSERASKLLQKMDHLRVHVLRYGVPDRLCSSGLLLRGKVWKVLLCVEAVDAEQYLSLVARGPCEARQYAKLQSDIQRTFRGEEGEPFWRRSSEHALLRVLNSLVHLKAPGFCYEQGMNCIAAVLLSVLPEPDAFAALSVFLSRHAPLYWGSAYIGVQAACVVLDAILAELDPALHLHLRSHCMNPYVYAFPCLSSAFASAKPLAEVLRLWDFLLAFGAHWLVVCLAAQIMSLSATLRHSAQPASLLNQRAWPRVEARALITGALGLWPRLSPGLQRSVRLHASDVAVVEELTGRRARTNSANR